MVLAFTATDHQSSVLTSSELFLVDCNCSMAIGIRERQLVIHRHVLCLEYAHIHQGEGIHFRVCILYYIPGSTLWFNWCWLRHPRWRRFGGANPPVKGTYCIKITYTFFCHHPIFFFYLDNFQHYLEISQIRGPRLGSPPPHLARYMPLYIFVTRWVQPPLRICRTK